MSDRFKFRVWHKPSKTYITNGNIDISNGVFATQNLLDADKFLIEQCTGIKDKNGNLIYEGDILKSIYSKKIRYEVIWENTSFYRREKIDKFVEDYILGKNDFIFEIIGNIHENKALLDD